MNEWRNSLCHDCCGGDVPTCLSAWFCSCCLYGRVYMREKNFPRTGPEAVTTANMGCLVYTLACMLPALPFGWIAVMATRRDLRTRFGIDGDGCTDCLLAFFCFPCTLAQMSTEFKDRAATSQAAPVTYTHANPYASPAARDEMSYRAPLPISSLQVEHSDESVSSRQPMNSPHPVHLPQPVHSPQPAHSPQPGRIHRAQSESALAQSAEKV